MLYVCSLYYSHRTDTEIILVSQKNTSTLLQREPAVIVTNCSDVLAKNLVSTCLAQRQNWLKVARLDDRIRLLDTGTHQTFPVLAGLVLYKFSAQKSAYLLVMYSLICSRKYSEKWLIAVNLCSPNGF